LLYLGRLLLEEHVVLRKVLCERFVIRDPGESILHGLSVSHVDAQIPAVLLGFLHSFHSQEFKTCLFSGRLPRRSVVLLRLLEANSQLDVFLAIEAGRVEFLIQLG
jgi:hypothetical protein